MLAIVLIVVVIMGCDNGSKKEQMVKAKQIPLEDFFKNPEKSGYQISPDGKYFSYKAPYENRMNIFVQK